jgi:hypothetical protein
LALIDVVLSNQNPTLQLTVHPNAGFSTENIEIRCEISQPPSISPLSSSKFDNIYLAVRTDNVKPSGILLMFDDSNDRCQVNRQRYVHIDVCNATLILIHLNHTILNDTLQKIDYSCVKGAQHATNSYRIISKYFSKKFYFFIYFYLEDRSARYYDPTYNSSSSMTHTLFLLLFVFVIQAVR